MARDPLSEIFEDLYEPTKLYLFGKRFRGLKLKLSELKKTEHTVDVADRKAVGQRGDDVVRHEDVPMPPPRLERMFRREVQGDEFKSSGQDDGDDNKTISKGVKLKPKLSRIYSFSYEGHYYKLPAPRVYLVWGNGEPADENSQRKTQGEAAFRAADTGLEGKDFRFASDIRVWKMDLLDLSLAVDLEVGSMQSILLEPMVMLLDQEAGGGGQSRMAMASRMAMNSRMAMASRMAMSSRMAMASRMAMVGPHQG